MTYRPLFIEHTPDHFRALKSLQWIDIRLSSLNALTYMFYRAYSAPLSHPVRGQLEARV